MKTLRFYSGTSPGSVFSTGRKILSFFLPFFLLSMHLSVSNQYRCEDIGSPKSLSECNPAASGSSLSAFLVDTTIYGTGDTCMIDEFDEPIFTILSQDCNEVCVQVNYPAEFVAHGTPVILYWENSQFLGDTVYGDSILCYTFQYSGLQRTSMVCANVIYNEMPYECCLDVFLDSLRCDFEVRELIQLENGQWELCVRSLDTCADTRKWDLTLISSGSSTSQEFYVLNPDTCFLIDSGITQVVVEHGVGINGFIIKQGCFNIINLNYFANCPFCFLDVLREDSCSYHAKINVCDSLNTHGLPYWISFGDGSPSVYTDTAELIHDYNGPGLYKVCITYVSSVAVSSGEEPVYSTCCKELDLSPSDCCPYHLIDTPIVELIDQLCDTALCFQINYPDDIDTGSTLKVFWGDADNSISVFEGDTTHCINYGGPGLYEVCAVYVYNDTTRTCCYSFGLLEDPCPDSSNFEFDLLLPSPEPSSCLNQYYTLSGFCDKPGVRHRWILDDGRIFETNNPPSPFVFSNFVNVDDSVCVTHELIFCDDTMRTTKCLSYPRQAIVGRPGDTTRLSDIILDPNHFGWTVEAFIRHYSIHPTIPLVIDGILQIDKNVIFSNGVWNMGWDSEILVDGKLFGLINVKIQIADRDSKGNTDYNCCRWRGIKSNDASRMNWSGVTISDAQIMLYYEEMSESALPRISVNNGTFHTNIFGIKSNQQAFLIGGFSNNEFRGADHRDTLCDCVAQNAIDVRGVEELNGFAPGGHNPTFTGGIKFPRTGSENLIHHYEKGFHFENTNLQTWNFMIRTLMDYAQPIPGSYRWVAGLDNPDDDTGIGIDFRFGHLLPSFLEFDRMHFRDHRIGVRAIHNTYSPHHLTAIADTEHSSISMKRLDEGYNIRYSGSSGIHGKINHNLLDSIRGSGIRIGFISSSNTTELDIINNDITIDGSNVEEAGGIAVIQTISRPWDQLVSIGLNRVDINTSSADANGIQMSNVGTGRIWNNYVEATNNNQAYSVTASPRALINCNEGWYGLMGLESFRNMDSELAGNNFKANGTNVELTGNHMTTSGMSIWWNDFNNSIFNNVIYNTDVVTGLQHHTRYNSWYAQGAKEQIEHLGNEQRAKECQFLRPDTADLGNPHYPYHTPSELFTGTDSLLEIDSMFCVLEDSIAPAILMVEVLDDLDTLYANRLSDTSLYEGYSAAMITELDLHLFRLVETYPNWKDSSQVIEDFYNAHDTGYIGQLSALEDSLESMEQFMSTSNFTVAPYVNELHTIYLELDSINTAFVQSTDSLEQDSLALVMEGYTAVIDSLGGLIEAESKYVDSILNLKIDALVDQNGLQPDSADHEWTRKTLNDIVLHYLQSDTLRSGDDTDLLTIAEYCYSDGGAPVYDARALAWALLADVIYEDQCVQASQLPSMVKNVTSKLQTLSLAPNPAGDQVQISWDPDMDGKVRIEMLSVNGQLIRSIELKNAESFYLMNLFGVTPGSYLIRVTNGKRIQVGKLIIN